MQRIGAEMIGGVAIRPSLDQRFHQGNIARRRSRHQRRDIHRQPMLQSMPIALTEDVLEVVGEVGDIALAALRGALLTEPPRRVELRFLRQPGCQHRRVVTGRDVIKLLPELAAWRLLAEHLDQQFLGSRLIEHRPGHRHLSEDSAADGVRLFLLALQFELARFLLPVFQGGLLASTLTCPATDRSSRPNNGCWVSDSMT